MARVSYFESMKKQYGENWIVATKPETIQRSCKRIVREMVDGIINYQEYGNCFLDGKFLDNFLISLRNELEINTLYYNAVSFYAQYCLPSIPNISIQITHLKILCEVYNVIYRRMEIIHETGNIGVLADISALLYNYRNHLIN